MRAPKRSGFKWNVNECLSLQREYELLEMTVTEIAAKHERSVAAILSRLCEEGFIREWEDARGFDKTEFFTPVTISDNISEEDFYVEDDTPEWSLETSLLELIENFDMKEIKKIFKTAREMYYSNSDEEYAV
jgi:hypothetical protein